MAGLAVCPSAIHLCFVRVTRLNSLGEPTPGPNNYLVSDKPMMLTITPDILAGEVKDLKGGCDQLIATYRGQDILKRFNLELDMGNVSPALEEILTGGAAVLDSAGDPIGVQFQVPCGTQQPYVAFEAWQDLWDCDHQPSTPYPYKRWVFPASRWQRGAETLQNDFDQPKFTGFTVGNANWGMGIYGDLSESVLPNGMYVFDTELPTADCSWQSHAIT
jgi:hypothetical protein